MFHLKVSRRTLCHQPARYCLTADQHDVLRTSDNECVRCSYVNQDKAVEAAKLIAVTHNVNVRVKTGQCPHNK